MAGHTHGGHPRSRDRRLLELLSERLRLRRTTLQVDHVAPRSQEVRFGMLPRG